MKTAEQIAFESHVNATIRRQWIALLKKPPTSEEWKHWKRVITAYIDILTEMRDSFDLEFGNNIDLELCKKCKKRNQKIFTN